MGKRRLLLLLAGLLGMAAGTLPSLAAGDSPSSSASFTAVDYAWDAGSGGHQVTIAEGGTVSFGYPSGASEHNADFGNGLHPSSCTQTAGPSSGSVPPVPNQPTAPGWSGTCTFNTPGTYTFHCDLHPFMTGTIVVEGPGTTTTGSPPTTTSPTTTTTTTTPPPPPPPVATQARISIPSRQRGRRIAGSVTVPASYAGGSLEIDVYSGSARVGRLIRRGLSGGTSRFSVSPRGHRRRLRVVVLLKAARQPTRSFRVSVLLTPGS